MLRKEEARNRRSQARTVALNTPRVPMTRDALLRSRVKGNFQARFWSSGGWGDSPTDCRKLREIGSTPPATEDTRSTDLKHLRPQNPTRATWETLSKALPYAT